MAAAAEFVHISRLLSELAPEADIGAIAVDDVDGRRVTVQTRTPGRLIGRRGATAEALRAALVEQFDDADLRLDILEMRPEPPLDP